MMNKFIKNIVLYFGLSALLFALFTSAIIAFFPATSFKIFNQDWLRIKMIIKTSKGNISKDTIFVGDSVGGQLLPYNGDNQLNSNGSTYPIGNYFLIKNALEHNKNINTVVYLSIPDVLGSNLERERTYNYFIKPFYTLKNKREILSNNRVKKILKKNKLLDLALFDAYKIIINDDYNYYDNKPSITGSFSDESIIWIEKIKILCTKHQVKFRLISPPVPISKREKSMDWNFLRNKVKNTPIENLMLTYLDNIPYLEDQYLKDPLHWKDDFINKHSAKFLKDIFNNID